MQELLKGNSTESLKDTHVVEYASFGAPPAPDSPDYAMAGTDLAKPLEDAMQSSDNLRAVIMFTDGSHNASSSVLTQAQRMRTRGIPCSSFPQVARIPSRTGPSGRESSHLRHHRGNGANTLYH